MNLEEIRKVAAEIKDATEEYETPDTPLRGGCIWTSIDLAEEIQTIVRKNVPRLATSSIQICIGNYYSQGDPAFPEQICRYAVAALREVDVRAVNAPYHTWLEIDATIIDLTFLYTTLPKRLWKGMEAQPIYHSADEGFLPYRVTLEYDCLARFTSSGDRLLDQNVDVFAAPNDVGEERLDLGRRIEKQRGNWTQTIFDWVLGRR
ncbi:hypothetical protein [Agrobacterium tumefaciens]|uniref:hypothetical protein n=1 Tax=Agrobacterium tumefaciens TaxID=358 RepID=UPI00287ED26F|nr:hypothetical protein [Agrobacterium tumefaciens]MDS7595429.1 hypothetical protein [Agrobacterium tumefaciens]